MLRFEDLTEQQRSRIEEWCVVLESGEFKQGKKQLFDVSEDAYCCLGIECVLYQRATGKGHWHEQRLESDRDSFRMFFTAEPHDSSYVQLPSVVSGFLGLGSCDPMVKIDKYIKDPRLADYEWVDEPAILRLSEANDAGFTFKEIAGLIRDTYLTPIPVED